MSRTQLLVSTGSDGGSLGVNGPRYSLLVARDGAEVVAAQQLRYEAFAEEMGANLPEKTNQIDTDYFDEFCDHLIVRDDDNGQVVGTYRMLPPRRALAAGMLYSETEFDLANIGSLRSSLVETGRSCVRADHRTGSVVGLVWAGIARYMLLSGNRYLAGCASVPLADGGSCAAHVWDAVGGKYYAPQSRRVTPFFRWECDHIRRNRGERLPALLRGYLRLGAVVCGPPAHDRSFAVADFFVLLDMQTIDERYLKYFLGGRR